MLIVTPTLGLSPWLDLTVQSVSQLHLGHLHVLVAPEKWKTELAMRFPRTHVVAESGGGMYAALNQGLCVPGDWDVFTWLNDDDLLLSAGLAQVLTRFSEDPGIDVGFGRVIMIDARGSRVVEMPATHHGKDVGPLLAAGVIPFNQPGTLIRRTLLEKVGPFDHGYRAAGDFDFFLRAAAARARFAFVDAEVAKFRVHPGQISAAQDIVTDEATRLFAAARENSAWLTDANRARWRFRWSNRRAYWERLRRHGWTSMEELYARK